MEAFKQLKKHAVVVLLNTKMKTVYNHMAPVVAGGLKDPKMGNTIPIAVVVSSDMATMYGAISYNQMKSDKNFRDLNKTVKKNLEGEPAGPQPEPKWYLKDGKGMHFPGKLVEVKKGQNGGLIVLKDKSGKVRKIAVSKLTPLAKKFVEGGSDTANENEENEEKADEGKELSVEIWESAKGSNTIKATFVSLSGGNITLKKENGKKTTFKLTLLSETSQARAKELAGK